MKYLLIILLTIFIYMSFIFVTNIFSGQSIKTNLKVCFLSLFVSLPFSLVIFSITFLVLLGLSPLTKLNISTENIFLLSFFSVFITFLVEFIVKITVSSIFSSFYNNKYSYMNLNESDMLKIISSNQKKVEITKIIITLVISAPLFFIICKLVIAENYIATTFFLSVANTILSLLMFKGRS